MLSFSQGVEDIANTFIGSNWIGWSPRGTTEAERDQENVITSAEYKIKPTELEELTPSSDIISEDGATGQAATPVSFEDFQMLKKIDSKPISIKYCLYANLKKINQLKWAYSDKLATHSNSLLMDPSRLKRKNCFAS